MLTSNVAVDDHFPKIFEWIQEHEAEHEAEHEVT